MLMLILGRSDWKRECVVCVSPLIISSLPATVNLQHPQPHHYHHYHHTTQHHTAHHYCRLHIAILKRNHSLKLHWLIDVNVVDYGEKKWNWKYIFYSIAKVITGDRPSDYYWFSIMNISTFKYIM